MTEDLVTIVQKRVESTLKDVFGGRALSALTTHAVLGARWRLHSLETITIQDKLLLVYPILNGGRTYGQVWRACAFELGATYMEEALKEIRQ